MKEIRVRDIPERLHSAIKIKAIQEGKTVNDFILDLLEKEINKVRIK